MYRENFTSSDRRTQTRNESTEWQSVLPTLVMWPRERRQVTWFFTKWRWLIWMNVWRLVSDSKSVPHELDGKLEFAKSGTLKHTKYRWIFSYLFKRYLSLRSMFQMFFFLSSQIKKKTSHQRAISTSFSQWTLFSLKKTPLLFWSR